MEKIWRVAVTGDAKADITEWPDFKGQFNVVATHSILHHTVFVQDENMGDAFSNALDLIFEEKNQWAVVNVSVHAVGNLKSREINTYGVMKILKTFEKRDEAEQWADVQLHADGLLTVVKVKF